MQSLTLPLSASGIAEVFVGYLAFLIALFLGARFLPAQRRMGMPGADGERLSYRLNGLLLFLLTSAGALVGMFRFGLDLSRIVRHFWDLLLVVNVIALVATSALVVVGRRRLGASLTRDSKLSAWLHDAWFGVLKDPRLFGVDLKMFAYQPSLIGLQCMNLAFLSAQLQRHGALTTEMLLYQLFTFSYLFTHYLREDFMLSTWDLQTERFGFMLVWGDLVYVPFLYSLVGWFLVDAGVYGPAFGPLRVGSSLPYLALLLLVHGVAHWIFRGANWQKDRFKRDPSARIWGKPAESLDGRLLVSGFWGIGRKVNYTGELGVYLSFALCAGFASPWPYLLPLSLTILLTQRAARDEKRCRAKYGELWQRYSERAKFRIFPFVY